MKVFNHIFSGETYDQYIKRFLSLGLSIIAILCLFPFMLVISIVIKADSKGPILFAQERIGKNKSHFKILKFRTMKTDTPKDLPTHLLDNPDTYITKVGKFLRKTSLDELPQLINIFKGEMSFIGPRPALWNQEDLIYERDLYNANSIRPGLSGWAQINGRDELEIDEKARLDGYYVENESLILDIKIFMKTLVSAFIKHEGVVEGGTGVLAKSKEV